MTLSLASQTKRFERKQEAILKAATRFFNARGLKGTNVADIAEVTGLTTTSITYYYRKKEDLAAACILRGIDILNDMVSLAEDEPSPARRLARFIDVFCAYQAEVVEETRAPLINFWDLRGMTGSGAEEAGAAFNDLFRRFRRWFTADEHRLARIEQNARAHLIFSALLWAKEWLAGFDPEDYRRAGERLSDVLIGGLAGAGAEWASSPSLPPPSPPTEISREAFLKVATELVNERGYKGASVDRISAKLKVTKGSFYHHNETKDDLVAQCFHRTFEIIRAAHREAAPATGSGWRRLCAVTNALVRTQVSERGPLLRYSALAAMPEDLRPALVQGYHRLSQRTAGIISDGIADGSIRAVDAAVAAQFVAGMINAAAELRHWVQGADEAAAVSLFVRPSLLGVFSAGTDR